MGTENTHFCVGMMIGEWVVFTCPHCDYIRYLNIRTKEAKVYNRGTTPHKGTHELLEANAALFSAN